MDRASATAVAQELRLQSASFEGGTVEFHGQSMLPLLRDQDALAVAAVSFDEIRPGDVVVLRLDDRYPALRVAEKLDDKLFLLADNWPGAVFEAWRDDVLGRVTGVRRSGVSLSCDGPAWRRAARRALLAYRARDAAAAARSKVRSLARRIRAHGASVRWGMLGMPEAIQVNVSSVCNLRCRMCPYLGVHRNDAYESFLSPETFERLLPTIGRIGAVAFGGSGEPLYNPHLLSFVERLRAEHPKARVDLITNGTLLSPEVASELVRLGIDALKISIDGATATTVQSIRRNSDFERIVANVRALAEAKRAAGASRPAIVANYMSGYGTYRELPEFVRLAREIGIERVHLLEIQPSSREELESSLAEGVRRDGGATLRYAIRLGQRLGVRLVLPTVSPGACLFPYHPHVSEGGDVNPCCFLDYDGRTLFDGARAVDLPALSFGNASATDFRTIWNSPAFRRFRRRNKKGDFPPGCRTCFDLRDVTARRLAEAVGPRPRLLA